MYSRRTAIPIAVALALTVLATPQVAHAETGGQAVQAQAGAEQPLPMPRPDRGEAVERDMIGAKVVSSDDRISGEVEKIVVRDGALLAVIRYGGLLGLGDARVALPVDDLEMVGSGVARVRISDAQVKRLPRYEG